MEATSLFIIDSGTNLNIISSSVYSRLKRKPKIKYSEVNAYGFNAMSPIPILGEFHTTLKANGTKMVMRFLVLDGNADNLLGFYAAERLGLMEIKEAYITHCEEEQPKLIFDINTATHRIRQAKVESIRSIWDPKGKYPALFEDRIGLMKGVEITIEVDPNIKPVQIPPYPVPIHLQELTKAKLDKMEQDGVIERVNGPLSWVSPLHVVPKHDPANKKLIGVRITSNNKALNKAILHQKRYMPSIRDLTYALTGMKKFSKVDIKDAFNQCSLELKCRPLTAFSTQWGTYQYCRLNMGLAIASELFQQTLTEMLKNIPNQKLATDDIIVYGRTAEECQLYTDRVLVTLNELGVTLSTDKCEFIKDEITFYGHKISADGIKPLEAKMKDFMEMGEPRTAKELHSFSEWLVISVIDHPIRHPKV
jgi:hypothetical protein